MAKIGRNASCPCGSGKKYKRCCLNVKAPPITSMKVKPPAMKYHFWRVGLEDLTGGSPPAFDFVKKELAAFQREDLFLGLSKINTLLSTGDPSRFDIQDFLCRSFLDSETIGKINALAKARGSDLPLVFDAQAVLNLQRLLVKHGVEGDLKLGSAAAHARLGRLLLAMNSLLDRSPDPATADENDITSMMVRNSFFNRLQRFDCALARYWELYRRLPSTFTTKNQCDIVETFKRATGIEIEEMLAVGSIMALHWMGVSRENVASFAMTIDPEKYFRASNIPAETVTKALAYMVTSWDQYRASITDAFFSRPAWEYSFRYELEHPLLRLPSGGVLPIELGFLRERVTSSVYYAIVNHLSGDNALVNNFTGKYGELFEEYVVRVLRRVYGDQVRKVLVDGQERSDALLSRYG